MFNKEETDMKHSTMAMVCFIATIVVSVIGSFLVTSETIRMVMLGLSFAFGAACMTGLTLMQINDKAVEDNATIEIEPLSNAA